MAHALDRYERSEIGVCQVESVMDSHVSALEGVHSGHRREAAALIVRLFNADLSTPPAIYKGQVLEFEGTEPVAHVLKDIRAFLASLPR